jgi:hypothetical protein
MDMLDHNDRIRASGNGRSGHDLYRLAPTHFTLKTLPGANFSDHLQFAWKIDSAHGIAIANRARKSGGIAIGGNILCEYPAGRFLQHCFFYCRQCARAANMGEYTLPRVEKGKRGHMNILPPPLSVAGFTRGTTPGLERGSLALHNES